MQSLPKFKNTKIQQTGSTLIIALILLAVMSLLGLSAMNNSIIQEELTSNFQNGSIALNNAETGIADALTKIAAADPTANVLLTAGSNYLVDASGTNGIRYAVNVTDNDDGDSNTSTDSDDELLITSIGTIGNTQRTVAMRIKIGGDYLTPSHAIITQEYLDITTASIISGTNRDVHSNTGVNIGNAGFVAGTVSSTGNITGNPTAPDNFIENADAVAIPDIIPANFKSRATHILKKDGTIEVRTKDTNGAATSTILSTETSPYDGWKWTDGNGTDKLPLWKMTTSNPLQTGIFYAEGDIQVEAAAGKTHANGYWHASLVTEGSIKVAGEARFKTYDDQDPSGIIAFITGEDLNLSGSASSTVEGLIGVRDHMVLSGQLNLTGNIITQGISTVNDPANNIIAGQNWADKDKLSGVVNLTFSGGNIPFLNPDAGLNTLSWAQVLN